MLLNRRQLAVEGLSCQKVFQLGRLGSKVLAYIGFTAEEGPGRAKRFSRPIKVPQSRFGQCLIELSGALDSVLDGAMRRIERRDRVILRTAQDCLHLADCPFQAAQRREVDKR